MAGANRTLSAIQLTPTERRLWDALRAEPGRVFSRKELIERAMPGTIVLERTIDVHIRGLRKKLGRDIARIRTVRRGGYCYKPEVYEAPTHGSRSSPS